MKDSRFQVPGVKIIVGGNTYYKRSRIPEWKFRLLVKYFALDMSATAASVLTGLTRKTVTTVFLKIRRRIAQECARSSPFATGLVRQDESHACALCVCGGRGCGFSNKSPVFAVLNYGGLVYTEMIPDCRKAALRTLIRGRAAADALNGWHGFDALVDASSGQLFKVKRRRDANELPQPQDRDAASFWHFARQRLEKFYGISNRTFHLHLKECEWRYNVPQGSLYPKLLKLLSERQI